MRLIDADALLEKIGNPWEYANPMTIIDLIINAPTVEPQKQWVGLSDDNFKDILWFTDEFIDGANWAQNKLKGLNYG